MKKNRIIPTIPYETLLNGTNKSTYKKILYNSILEALEQGINSKKKSVIVGKVQKTPNSTYDIVITKDSWKKNLEVILEHYISTEEYENCTRVVDLIYKYEKG